MAGNRDRNLDFIYSQRDNPSCMEVCHLVFTLFFLKVKKITAETEE